MFSKNNNVELTLLFLSIIMVTLHYGLNMQRNLSCCIAKISFLNIEYSYFPVIVGIFIVITPLIIADIIAKNNIYTWKYIFTYVLAFGFISVVYYYLLNINIKMDILAFVMFGVFINELISIFVYDHKFRNLFSFLIVMTSTFM